MGAPELYQDEGSTAPAPTRQPAHIGSHDDYNQKIESRIMPATASFTAHSSFVYQMLNFKKSKSISASSSSKKTKINPIHVVFVIVLIVFVLFQMQIIQL